MGASHHDRPPLDGPGRRDRDLVRRSIARRSRLGLHRWRLHRSGLNERLYDTVNNGVYKAGFSRRQKIYEREVENLFAMLGELDEQLAGQRFLFGAAPVETDWRLFTTLVRFDAVYQIHFKCSLRKLIEFENLWPYARDLYQWPGIAYTVDFDEIRAHYYLTHPMINPSGLVAIRPAADFRASHSRAAL